jgi:hypothetical protein
MGLGKYRPYKDEFHDEGLFFLHSTLVDFVCTGFHNRKHNSSMWDVSSVASVEVR